MKVRFPKVTFHKSPARTNKKGFHRDPALKWADANPKIAAACLAIPPEEGDPHDNQSAAALRHDATGPSIPRNFDDYWSRRGSYVQTLCSQADIEFGKSLSTHVLSAPLTLATQLLSNSSHTTLLQQPKVGTPFRCCCLGARAESHLPLPYWREVLVVLGWRNAACQLDLELDFLGPDVVPRVDPVTVQHQGSQLRLRWVHAETFHDYVERNDQSDEASAARVDRYDAFVLFNPGLGHRNLQRSWDPTIDVLRCLRRPVLLTAHSALDAARDSQHLCEAFDASASYTENAFASRITYEDPLDAGHIVRPNHSVALL